MYLEGTLCVLNKVLNYGISVAKLKLFLLLHPIQSWTLATPLILKLLSLVDASLTAQFLYLEELQQWEQRLFCGSVNTQLLRDLHQPHSSDVWAERACRPPPGAWTSSQQGYRQTARLTARLPARPRPEHSKLHRTWDIASGMGTSVKVKCQKLPIVP